MIHTKPTSRLKPTLNDMNIMDNQKYISQSVSKEFVAIFIKGASIFPVLSLLVVLLMAGCSGPASESNSGQEIAVIDYDPVKDSITLPDGFSASIVVDSLGYTRHISIAPNGDIYVKTRGEEGGIAALRDTTGDYRPDIIEYFSDMTPVRGGVLWETGVVVHNGYIWASNTEAVYRWPIPEDGALVPEGEPEIIVSGFPEPQEHASKTFAFDNNGYIYVNVGAPTNACQEEARIPGSAGLDPCPHLERQAGIWRFYADSLGQTQEEGMRYATGIRNVVGTDWNSANDALYVAQHGRDQLNYLWPDIYSEKESAELPAEEIFRLSEGANAGWPYCYYDWMQEMKVLSPEYGGDGQEVGRCAEYLVPVVAFPGHWAPNDLLFYTSNQFPERYRGGAFVAFHGSWNRAPFPQEGYKVSFIPFKDGELSGEYETFADGFMGEESTISLGYAKHRPMALAIAPDGALYISDSIIGRIWRVVYTGEKD